MVMADLCASAPWEEADLRAVAEAYGAGRDGGLGDAAARAEACAVYRERYPEAQDYQALEETDRLLDLAAARFGAWA